MKNDLLYVFGDDSTKYVTSPAEPFEESPKKGNPASENVAAGKIEIATYAKNSEHANVGCEALELTDETMLIFISVPLVTAGAEASVSDDISNALLEYSSIDDDETISVAAKLAAFHSNTDTIFILLDESCFTETPPWAKHASHIARYAYNGTDEDLTVVIVTRDRHISEVEWPGCRILFI